MYRLWQSGKLVPPGTSDALALGWPLAALAIILYTWWYLQTSWTTVTETELRQRCLSAKPDAENCGILHGLNEMQVEERHERHTHLG